jgi:hypothetical protein
LTNPFIVGLKEAVNISLKLDMNTSIRNYNIKINDDIKKKIQEIIEK